MKNYPLALLCGAVLILCSATASHGIHTQGRGGTGIDFNARGSWRVVGELSDNWNFSDDLSEETYAISMRARTWFDFTTSGGVKAVLGTEIGDARFGEPGALDLGGDNETLEVKHLYVQFPWPNTDLTFSAGLQGFALPGYFSSPILDDDVAGLVVSTPFSETVSLTLAWLRPYDLEHAQDGTGSGLFGETSDEFDIVAALAPITLNGAIITPYALYAFIGQDFADQELDLPGPSSGDHSAWWIGGNVALTLFDPLTISADFIYGVAEFKLITETIDQAGWYLDLAISYPWRALTTELFFIYASGDDAGGDDGRMPSVSPDFVATSFFFNGSPLGSGFEFKDPASVGLWAIGIRVKDITLVDKLTHTVTIMYVQGTSDADAEFSSPLSNAFSRAFLLAPGDGQGPLFFTKDDSFLELNVDSTYQMHEHLQGIVEFGYIIPDFDLADDDHALKLAAGIKYDF
jgi:hypothetical protein